MTDEERHVGIFRRIRTRLFARTGRRRSQIQFRCRTVVGILDLLVRKDRRLEPRQRHRQHAGAANPDAGGRTRRPRDGDMRPASGGNVRTRLARKLAVFLGEDPKSRLVRAVMTRLYRASLRACPAVFFQNRDDEALFRARKMLRKEKSVLLRGSGVNLDHFAPKPLPEEPTFLCIARLIRDKGVGEYLQACRIVRQKYPSVPCLLLGPYDSNPSAIRPEELLPYLQEQVVTYCGEQEDVRPYLERCSVFVLPSYREGTPKTVLEAMATGRAILTTDTVGCRETVREGENGFLVPVKDASALAERMCWFLEHSEEIPRLAENGRRMAEELFDVRKVNASICETMGLDELSPERKDCL